MGALPSREANEAPSSLFFANCGRHVVLRVPLTPHLFTSADSLAFRQLFHARNNQSSKYNFDIRDITGMLPDSDAKDFLDAQDEDWGEEMDEVDLSMHYVDAKPGDDNNDCHHNHHPPPRHMRRSVEDRKELYRALVTDPTEGKLVDTNATMCDLFEQEQRWRAARKIVMEARKAQRAASSPSSSSSCGPVAMDVEHGANAPPPRPNTSTHRLTVAAAAAVRDPARIAAAHTVPPPSTWLCPLAEAIAIRLTREEEAVVRETYKQRMEQLHEKKEDGKEEHASANGEEGGVPMCADHGALLGTCSAHHIMQLRRRWMDQDGEHSDGEGGERRREDGANASEGDDDGDEENEEEDDGNDGPAKEESAATDRHDDRNGASDKRKTKRSHTGRLDAHKSTASQSRPRYRFESVDAYKDGRIHLVEEDGVLYLFAYNKEYVEAKREGRRSRCSTSSRCSNGDGAARNSTIKKETSKKKRKEEEGGSHHARVSDSPVAAQAALPTSPLPPVAPVLADPALPTAAVRGTTAPTQRFRAPRWRMMDEVEQMGSSSSSSRSPSTSSALSSGASSSSRSSSASASRSHSCSLYSNTVADGELAGEGRAAVVVQGKAKRAKNTSVSKLREFVLPICAICIVGMDGLIPSQSRGAKWMHGVDDDAEEEAYRDSLPLKCPVLRRVRFVDGAVGEKILNRAVMLRLVTYRHSCLRAGLSDSLVRPSWNVFQLGSVPHLQLIRELRFRVRAAMAEVDNGDTGLRDWLEKHDPDNDFARYINVKRYVRRGICPPENHIRDRSRRAVEEELRGVELAVDEKELAALLSGDSDGEEACDSRDVRYDDNNSEKEEEEDGEGKQSLPNVHVTLSGAPVLTASERNVSVNAEANLFTNAKAGLPLPPSSPSPTSESAATGSTDHPPQQQQQHSLGQEGSLSSPRELPAKSSPVSSGAAVVSEPWFGRYAIHGPPLRFTPTTIVKRSAMNKSPQAPSGALQQPQMATAASDPARSSSDATVAAVSSSTHAMKPSPPRGRLPGKAPESTESSLKGISDANLSMTKSVDAASSASLSYHVERMSHSGDVVYHGQVYPTMRGRYLLNGMTAEVAECICFYLGSAAAPLYIGAHNELHGTAGLSFSGVIRLGFATAPSSPSASLTEKEKEKRVDTTQKEQNDEAEETEVEGREQKEEGKEEEEDKGQLVAVVPPGVVTNTDHLPETSAIAIRRTCRQWLPPPPQQQQQQQPPQQHPHLFHRHQLDSTPSTTTSPTEADSSALVGVKSPSSSPTAISSPPPPPPPPPPPTVIGGSSSTPPPPPPRESAVSVMTAAVTDNARDVEDTVAVYVIADASRNAAVSTVAHQLRILRRESGTLQSASMAALVPSQSIASHGPPSSPFPPPSKPTEEAKGEEPAHTTLARPAHVIGEEGNGGEEEEEDLAVVQARELEQHGHVFTYDVDYFRDGDVVGYNNSTRRWELLSHIQRRRLRAMITRAHEGTEEQLRHRLQRLEKLESELLFQTDPAVLPSTYSQRQCEFLERIQWHMPTFIPLEDAVLQHIKDVLMSKRYENRDDPGWLRLNDKLLSEGRYFVWSFRSSTYRLFFGCIPKFVKDAMRRKKAMLKMRERRYQQRQRKRRKENKVASSVSELEKRAEVVPAAAEASAACASDGSVPPSTIGSPPAVSKDSPPQLQKPSGAKEEAKKSQPKKGKSKTPRLTSDQRDGPSGADALQWPLHSSAMAHSGIISSAGHTDTDVRVGSAPPQLSATSLESEAAQTSTTTTRTTTSTTEEMAEEGGEHDTMTRRSGGGDGVNQTGVSATDEPKKSRGRRRRGRHSHSNAREHRSEQAVTSAGHTPLPQFVAVTATLSSSTPSYSAAGSNAGEALMAMAGAPPLPLPPPSTPSFQTAEANLCLTPNPAPSSHPSFSSTSLMFHDVALRMSMQRPGDMRCSIAMGNNSNNNNNSSHTNASSDWGPDGSGEQGGGTTTTMMMPPRPHSNTVLPTQYAPTVPTAESLAMPRRAVSALGSGPTSPPYRYNPNSEMMPYANNETLPRSLYPRAGIPPRPASSLMSQSQLQSTLFDPAGFAVPHGMKSPPAAAGGYGRGQPSVQSPLGSGTRRGSFSYDMGMTYSDAPQLTMTETTDSSTPLQLQGSRVGSAHWRPPTAPQQHQPSSSSASQMAGGSGVATSLVTPLPVSPSIPSMHSLSSSHHHHHANCVAVTVGDSGTSLSSFPSSLSHAMSSSSTRVLNPNTAHQNIIVSVPPHAATTTTTMTTTTVTASSAISSPEAKDDGTNTAHAAQVGESTRQIRGNTYRWHPYSTQASTQPSTKDSLPYQQ